MTFDRWWCEFGSFLLRDDEEITAETVERIAAEAWDEAGSLSSMDAIERPDDQPEAML